MNINDFLIEENSTILECLKKLNEKGGKILFLVDDKKKTKGSLTDGDIRRALIKGYNVNDKAKQIAKKDFIYLLKDSEHEAKKLMEKFKIKFVPLLDNRGRILKIFEYEKESEDFSNIAVLIMAGGKGKRLRPLTEKKPKPLLEIGNTSLIENIIDKFILDGFKNIYVSLNYKKEMIEKKLISKYPDIFDRASFIKEKKPLGTAGALFYMRNLKEDTVIVHNADIISDIDFSSIIKYHKKNKNDITSVVIPQHIEIEYGIVSVNRKKILNIVEKPVLNFLILSGINIFQKNILKNLKDDFINMDELLNKKIVEKKKVGYFLHNGFWYDVGNRESYEKISRVFGG
ncbi:MAG: sugar phosphate nucleotidyltransferase [candidate division WOR-3 bacterium]